MLEKPTSDVLDAQNERETRPQSAATDPFTSSSDAARTQPDELGESNGTVSTPDASTALSGELNAWTEKQWCKKCQTEVVPIDKGKCPRCSGFLRLNFSARRHPVNKLRRQQLLDKFVRDYRPTSQRLQSMCEQYAAIIEQLEVLKPGSPDHQRLVQLSQLLGAALEESKLSRPPTDISELDTFSTDQLIERTTAILRELLRLRDAKVDATPIDDNRSLHASPIAEVIPPDVMPTPKPEPIACPFCHRSCVGPEHFAYRLCHWDDPEEVDRRREEATATMLHTMRHGSGITRW